MLICIRHDFYSCPCLLDIDECAIPDKCFANCTIYLASIYVNVQREPLPTDTLRMAA